MDTSILDFLKIIDQEHRPTIDRAVALLWWAGRADPRLGMTAKDVAGVLEAGGHPKQNVSRLERQMAEDRRTSKAGHDAWRLHPATRRECDRDYAFALLPTPKQLSDSVLPRELFAISRGYIERVVEQINASYDAKLWDCCAVMCRRLLETLIIEVYEKLGRTSDIKGRDGHFLMYNGLIAFIESDLNVHLGRNAIKGLKDHKALGDQSAHNRRFLAHQDDIDRARDGLRVAAQELLHLSGFDKA